MQPNRVIGLDIFRSIAVIMVLLSHSRFGMNDSYPLNLPFGTFGFYGVELFFVLSGFLIGSIFINEFTISNTYHALFTFWKRRWFRTLPNYYLFLSINIIIAIYFKEEIGNLFKFLFFFQNTLEPRPLFFRESWSLAIEEWFYLLIPTVIIITTIVFKKLKPTVLIISILIVIVSPMYRYFLHHEFGFDTNTIRMIVAARLDSIIFGVLVAWVKFYYFEKYRFFSKYLWVFPLIFLGIIIFQHYYINIYYSVYGKIIYLSFVSFTFAMFLSLFDSILKTKYSFTDQIFVNISTWSYSIYLINLPLEKLVKFALPQNTKLNTAIFYFFVIGSSAAIYRFYEKPITKLREK